VFRTLAILFISLSAAATAQAGPTLEHLLSMSGQDAILLDTDWDVVVAEVRSVDGGATNGNPPRLDLAVLRVLRGGAQVDRRRAVWEPFPNDIDWIGGGAEEAIARWEADSLSFTSPPWAAFRSTTSEKPRYVRLSSACRSCAPNRRSTPTPGCSRLEKRICSTAPGPFYPRPLSRSVSRF
jgi:hypothetical protein